MATEGQRDRKPAPPKSPSSDEAEISGRRHKPTKEEEALEVNTPGDGTLPDPQPGGEADPGTG